MVYLSECILKRGRIEEEKVENITTERDILYFGLGQSSHKAIKLDEEKNQAPYCASVYLHSLPTIQG
jgi:hypothetical protein